MAKNQAYRAFVARPTHVLGLDGELLDGAPVLGSLASEVRDISSYATYVVRNDEALGKELARVTATAPAVAGRRAGVIMPDFLVSGKSGRSRKEFLWFSIAWSPSFVPTRSVLRSRTVRVPSM